MLEQLTEYAPWATPLLILAGAAAYKFAVNFAAKKASGALESAIDKALDAGDADWDMITLAIVNKLEQEIPDGITAEHPKIQKLAKKLCSGEGYFGLLRGQEKRVAVMLATVARSIDKKAKEKGNGKKEAPEKEG